MSDAAQPARASAHPAWHPNRWPLRWRLTAVLAGLTCLILVVFAVVVGRLAANRLHNDFNTDLTDSAHAVAAQVPTARFLGGQIEVPHFEDMTTAPSAFVHLVLSTGEILKSTTPDTPSLGRPRLGLSSVGNIAVETVAAPRVGLGPTIYVQYARSTDSLDATIGRLWLFLITGIVAGTLLAAVAGYALAGRTLRPVSQLTATARKVAATRDPSRRIPEPEAKDEVAELARTLDKMLRELEAARAETNQIIQAQRDFVADASHELRTPLTSILANLELLQASLEERSRGGGEDGEMVTSALASSRRMSRLVSDLLLLARADAGRIGSRRECDLAEIGAAAVSEVRPVADGHPLHLEADSPVAVKGNPDELHRLALNLLENGLRHTPSGTEVSLTVERRNGDAVLEVCDDGPGLPDAMGEQLFSRFVRGSGPADVSPADGAGLGLAIVKAVATGHGGDVEAGSSPNGGARFTVRLPLLDGGSGPNGAPVADSEPARASSKF